MPRERKQEFPGRPAQYVGERRPITTQWPVELIAFIDTSVGKGNRTRWLIEAAQEKKEREELKSKSGYSE